MPKEAEPETPTLTVDAAKELAIAHQGKPDPFPDIAPSLLSAKHIKQYILKTGLIAPFDVGSGRNSRLKKASYEGRVGKKAFLFNEKNELTSVLLPNKSLLVPANSIVFVEADLDFRLPQYIALRFNLQIRHVHRGLLLGTGPLVDPGFWGKLCIPLHNLTNEVYEIPQNEGLIWVEFTKTTSDSNEGRVALGGDKEDKGHWDIEELLWKAAKQFKGPPIGIRSSIPVIVDEAQKALNASKKAAMDIRKTKFLFYGVGGFGTFLAIAAVVSLWIAFYSAQRNDINSLQSDLNQISSNMASLASSNGAEGERFNTLKDKYYEILQLLMEYKTKIEALQNEVSELSKNHHTLENSAPSIPDAK